MGVGVDISNFSPHVGSREEHENYLGVTLNPLCHNDSNKCIGPNLAQFIYNNIVEETINERRDMLLVELTLTKHLLIQSIKSI